jgi:hypothetical protein
LVVFISAVAPFSHIKVPGSDTGVTAKTGVGFYGHGIYLSPDPSVSLGYTSGSGEYTRLLVCAAVMGRFFPCRAEMFGAPCEPGYNSHVSPCNNEVAFVAISALLTCSQYVLFNPAAVLPVLVVHLQHGATNRQQSRLADNVRTAEDLAELARKPKNNVEFYLGKGRQVLEMAEVDDDDDTNAVFDNSLQLSRWHVDEYTGTLDDF